MVKNLSLLLLLLFTVGCRPAITVDLQINGDTADTPPGPEITADTEFTITGIVDNIGSVAVSDINHTVELAPGMQPIQLALKSGDTNKNYVLDTDETWKFEETEKAKLGEHRLVMNVTGDGVEASDPAHYKGKFDPPPPPPDRVEEFKDQALAATADPERVLTATQLAAACDATVAKVTSGELDGRIEISEDVSKGFRAVLDPKGEPALTAWQPFRRLLQDWFDKLGQEGATNTDYASLLVDCAKGLRESV